MTSDFEAQAVLAQLGNGRDNAHPLGEIAEALNYPRRAVEAAVQALRADSFPVCSDGSGIWIGDREDVAATIRSLRGRLVSQYRTMLALRRTLRRMRSADVEQTSIWDNAA